MTRHDHIHVFDGRCDGCIDRQLTNLRERESLLKQALTLAAIPLEALNLDNANGAKWMAKETKKAVEEAVAAIRKVLAGATKDEIPTHLYRGSEKDAITWCGEKGRDPLLLTSRRSQATCSNCIRLFTACKHPRRRYADLGSMGTMQCLDCFDLELGTTWPPGFEYA